MLDSRRSQFAEAVASSEGTSEEEAAASVDAAVDQLPDDARQVEDALVPVGPPGVPEHEGVRRQAERRAGREQVGAGADPTR